MLTLEICNSCKECIEDYGEIAYETFFEMCVDYISTGRFIPNSKQLPICDFLEKKNYAISTELGEGVAFKPLGLQLKEEGSYIFCLNSMQ
jgi:hypothetical protein